MTDGMVNAPLEVDDVARTLAATPPFDGLPADRIREIARATQLEQIPAGSTILRQGGSPADSLFVIGSGTVEIVDEGRIVDQPGAGEVFGELSLLTGASPMVSVIAGNDLSCLVVDGDAARRVLGTAGGVAFVQASMRRGLLRSLEREPRSLADEIGGATDEDAAIAAARELPDHVCSLVDDGADAVKVGHVIGASIDALTQRLLDLAVGDLGEPPVAWAWLALGSEARLEQALHTDQDHALAYDLDGRSVDDVDPYFAALAERVTAGIERAGIPRCNGDAMATTALLRRSVDGWKEAFVTWMSDVGREGSLFSSVTFDQRRVGGPLDIEPVLFAVIATASDRHPEFVRHLGHRVLDHKPPTGFVRNFVVQSKGEHAGRLDIKHGGVSLVASIARLHAIAGGLPEKGTIDRLRAAERAGRIDEESRRSLEEAFRLLWQIRLEHQVRQVRSGETPDDFVDPAELGPIARLGLKEAFRIIGKEQQGVAAEIGARF